MHACFVNLRNIKGMLALHFARHVLRTLALVPAAEVKRRAPAMLATMGMDSAPANLVEPMLFLQGVPTLRATALAKQAILATATWAVKFAVQMRARLREA